MTSRIHDASRTPGLWRMVLALLGAALVAWALIVATWVGEIGLYTLVQGVRLPSHDVVLPMAATLAVIGLPVAAVTCLAVGMPAWLWARWRGLHGRRQAAWFGAGAGLLIGLVLQGVNLLDGLRSARDPGFEYSIYRWGVLVIDDGIPTTAGWAFAFLRLAGLVVVGVVAGLVAWRLAGLRSRA